MVAVGSPIDDFSSGDGGKKQTVHVFEGSDNPHGSSGNGPPILMEHRMAIPIKLDPGGCIVTCAVHSKGTIVCNVGFCFVVHLNLFPVFYRFCVVWTSRLCIFF